MNPEEMKEAFHRNAIREWKTIRESSYNPNTKGGDFEGILQQFLQKYFDESFNIRTRTAVIDRKLNSFEKLSDAENEFDVVATYRGTKPQILFNVESTDWVPYDGVGFVCEVKSKMTTQSLRDDLEKLTKLRDLGYDYKSRFGNADTMSTVHPTIGEEIQLTVPWQLHCLVYDQCDVSEKTYKNILYENGNAFDMMLIMDDDHLVLSPNLPLNAMYGAKRGQAGNLEPYGLLVFLIGIASMTPHSPTINTARTLKSILNAEMDN